MKGKHYTPKEAMEILIDMGYSKYKISQSMDMQPIMVDRYLKEEVKTMRESAAKNLLRDFNITIEDRCINGQQKTMWVDKNNALRAD